MTTSIPVLAGNRCQCTACGLYFTSERTFDHHRYGDHAVSRHCLTVVEMMADGWMQNEQGFWTDIPLRGAYVALAGPRSPDPLPPHSPAPDGPLLHTFREAA